MKKITLAVFMIFSLTISCLQNSNSGLAGEWEIEELKVVMPGFQNTDIDQVLEVTGDVWEVQMQMRKIRTVFGKDGSYRSIHRDLLDSIIFEPVGTWRIENDTLVIEETSPMHAVYRYRMKLDKNTVEFWSVEDFDHDGEADDEYYSKQTRVK